MITSRVHVQHLAALSLFGLAFLLLVAGCAGSGANIDESTIARQYLPAIREVPHPDSLVHLDLTFEEDKLKLEFERSYGSMRQLWSAGYRDTRGGDFYRTRDYQTFATLQSRELTLATLQFEMGVGGLSRSLAERMIDERMAAYREFLVFDVFVFIDERYPDSFADTNLDAPGTRLTLVDSNGQEYAPLRVDSYRPERARMTGADPGAFHRQNTVYFRRVVDGRDLLEDVQRLELMLKSAHPAADLVFTWEVEPADG